MSERAATAPLMVSAEAVHKAYGDNHVLRGIDFEAKRGEVVAILGPSGSGKSTFLRCINHLDNIDGGRLLVDGQYVGYAQNGSALVELKDREVARRRADIGMVFQQWNLFHQRTVIENLIEAPMLVRGLSRADATARGKTLLAQVGLSEKLDAFPSSLSGGQQQRVAIARALAMQPQLMLFDEATSALDPELVGEVLNVIKRLAETGMTMILVTHEVAFAREIADTVYFMDGGVVVEKGPPSQVIDQPQHERTQAFLARITKEAP